MDFSPRYTNQPYLKILYVNIFESDYVCVFANQRGPESQPDCFIAIYSVYYNLKTSLKILNTCLSLPVAELLSSI